MKRTNSIAVLVLFSIFTASSSFALTPVKMLALKVTSQIQLSGDPADQVSSILATPNSILVVGTSAKLGFISAYDRTGLTQLWNLSLGGSNSSDAIATTLYRENSGTVWVVGASAATPPLSTPAPFPAGTLNPSGVVQDTSTAISSLTQLDIWKVNSKGLLVSSYTQAMPAVIFPDSISVKGGIVSVSGQIAAQNSSRFSISLSSTGVFAAPRVVSVKSSEPISSIEVKTTLSTWKAFMTTLPIKGLPSWKPKNNSQVLIRYDAKTKAIMAAYQTTAEIVTLSWEKSLGVVALLSYPTGYSLAIVK